MHTAPETHSTVIWGIMTSNQRHPSENYALGQHLLTLRSRVKLTQAELAARIGLHRRSIQKWESGETYPSADNLRALIKVLLDLGVFTRGQARAEASALWQSANQETPARLEPFDFAWFDKLLAARTATNDQRPTTNETAPADPSRSPLITVRQQIPVGVGLPRQPTAFIGRDTELAEITKILATPTCRLLTLLGPGGVGKTRLALEIAARQTDVFRDGVAFVALASVGTANQIVAAIGNVLTLSFAGQGDPTAHLLGYLRTRHMLLLLDNFEHLLAGADLVYAILQRAPNVTILVTSRERLNLQAEWLFNVEALSYPLVIATPLDPPPIRHAATRVDWGLAQDVPVLYGRTAELATLTQWVMTDRCRLITLVGIGGIGKTSLAVTLARQLAPHFAAVVFRSLGEAPPLPALLDQLIHSLATQQVVIPQPISEKIARIIDLLRQTRCLLILDNLETLRQAGRADTPYLTGYEMYGTLFKTLGETAHQSCLLLTSREQLSELTMLEGPHAAVRSLRVTGLTEDACHALIADQALTGTTGDVVALVQRFDGNPLALKLVAAPVHTLFGGNIAAFLSEGALFFAGVGDLLEQQISRASPLEQALLIWMAIEREPVTLEQLMGDLLHPQRPTPASNVNRTSVLAALHALWRRNLIERGQTKLTFTLQRVVIEYLTERLVTSVADEIQRASFDTLRHYALMQATAKDYVRHSQARLIATPLLQQLGSVYGHADAVEQQLLPLLDVWRTQPLPAQGYGPGNILHLLRLLRGHLRGLNLARLALLDVYWQGVEAQDSNLAHAFVRNNVFTEAFGIVHAVASTPSGSYWAASSVNGAVQIWRAEGRTIHLSIPAHTRQVKTLAFSPDEQILASGSWDCTIKLWNMQNGALVGMLEGHTDYVQDIAFAPDGRQLASASDDQTVRIWDVATGVCLKTIHAHTDNAYGVVWSADGHWVASCGFDHKLRVWDVASGTCMQTLSGHTRPVSKLAFSPDMRLLASGGFDRILRVWDVASGQCIKLFAEHGSTIMAIAWHPDGRTLASCSYDGTIRLWDLAHDSAQRILLGHVASINSIAFSAGGKLLLSGSDDQTVRVWDVAIGWCVRVIEGYGLFCFGVVWSPDGRSLLSANSDTTLTLWDVATGRARMTLRGHTHTVYGVAWSPDGRWLASSGFDQTVRLWDAQTGVCVRVISAHTDTIYRVVWWSPDGRWLASAGRDQAVRIWDINTGASRWVGRAHTGPINEVVWSPDGERLASCGEDRTVRLWRAADGALLQTLAGHESSVAGVAWSPDGRRLASCGGGGTFGELFVWDAERGARLNSLVGHDSVISRVAWSQDSQRLFSGGMTGVIKWWDAESGANLHTQQKHQGWIRSLSVSPDGSMLVSSGEDGIILLWDTAQAELIRTLRIDRPYERMDINGLTGITTAQRAALLALGAVERNG